MKTFEQRWHLVQQWLLQPLRAAIISMVMAFALLLLFQQVVAGAVAQGELRQRASAAEHEGVWRCKPMQDQVHRAACLERSKTAYQRTLAPTANLISE
jgi:hypothetical protein